MCMVQGELSAEAETLKRGEAGKSVHTEGTLERLQVGACVGENEEFRPREHPGSELPPGGQALDQAWDVGLSSTCGGLPHGILTVRAGGGNRRRL